MCLLACLSLCVVGCQLHPPHIIIVIDLQAFLLWHHSKDCIQVQHNFTRYKEGEKTAFCSSKETPPLCLLVVSVIPARTVFI